MLPFPNSRIATTGGVHTTLTLKYITDNFAREFSHLSKLIVHGILAIYSIDKGFFVRFYAPTNCDIADGSYVRATSGGLT